MRIWGVVLLLGAIVVGVLVWPRNDERGVKDSLDEPLAGARVLAVLE